MKNQQAWWKELRKYDTSWVSVAEFYKQNKNSELTLSAYATNHDPLFKRADIAQIMDEQNKKYGLSGGEAHEILGAVEINKVVFIIICDPDDGYRSHADQMLAVPRAKLKTRLPEIDVKLTLSDSSHWDTPQDEDTPSNIDLVALSTGDIIMSFGTECSDSYYPCAHFGVDVETLQKSVAPFASQKQILKKMSKIIQEKSSNQGPKAPKKM